MHYLNQFLSSKTRTAFQFTSSSLLGLAISTNSLAAPVFINEFHYDNNGTDINEGVEIAGLAGTSLDNWTLLFYNGTSGAIYRMQSLSGTINDSSNGFGVLSFMISGLQNGPNDGIALVDDNATVLEFISYEGPLLATEGAATGLTSIDVGISQSTTLDAGISIQRTGLGIDSSEFTWILDSASFGAINNQQQFASPVPIPAALPLFLSGVCGLLVSRTCKAKKARNKT